MPDRHRGLLRYGLLLALAVVVLDQLLKIWADGALTLYQPVALLPVLNLNLHYNTGAAFSFLAGESGWQRWFFTVLAIAVSVYLGWWIRQLRSHQRWHASALALIMGGALGNVVDRLLYGHVVDYIDVHYAGWHYPAFNLADSAITVGVAMLIVLTLFGWEPA